MNCQDVGRYLHVYLDGEFAPDDHIAFEDHLARCPGCRQRVAGEEAFLRDFRSKLQPRPAPAHFRARLTGHFEKSSDRPWLERGLQWAPLVVAALILAVVTWPIAHKAGEGDVRVAAGTSPDPEAGVPAQRAPSVAGVPAVRVGTAHSAGVSFASAGRGRTVAFGPTTRSLRSMRPDVFGGADKVLAYLSRRLPFHTTLPFHQNLDLRLVGARQTRFEGRPAALFVYERAGDRIAIVQTRGSARERSSTALRVARSGSTTVARFVTGGLAHTVVCELDPERLSLLLRDHLVPSLSLR